VGGAANRVMSSYVESAYHQRTREGERRGSGRRRREQSDERRWDDDDAAEGDGSVGGIGPLILPAPRDARDFTGAVSGGEGGDARGRRPVAVGTRRLGVSVRRDEREQPLLRFLLSLLPRWLGNWGGFL
jgi:hypothetical protein